jgi:TctA family transporter
MEAFSNLAFGLGVALAPGNLLCMVAGGLLGTLAALLPGLGPVAALAMLLPASYALAPASALILLGAMVCGAQHGRRIAAILVQPPGDVPGGNGTLLARQSRAAVALAATGLGAFAAVSMATLLLAVGAPLLAALALPLGPTETFSVLLLGLVGAAMLATGSRLKALAMVLLGLLLGLVGQDRDSGVVRFAFALPELADGIGLVTLAMGVFGCGEIPSQLAQAAPARQVVATRLSALWPQRRALADAAPAALRGGALGMLLGLVPGGGARMAAFAAQALEQKMAGAPRDAPAQADPLGCLVAPDSASHAGAQSAFLPLLGLGLPTNAVMVLLLGVLVQHQIRPGPALLGQQPALFWGLIASLWLVNLLLLLLSLPLVGLWVRLLRLPYRWLFPAIVLVCAVGAYTLQHSIFDIWLVAAFGFAGYAFHKLGLVPAPLLLGFVLGPILEDLLQQALRLSNGDWSVFVRQPLSAGLLVAALCLLVLLPAVRARHKATFIEH